MKIEFLDPNYYRLPSFTFGPVSGRRYVVFDVEATGASFSEDSITQIGAVTAYDDGPRDGEAFCSLVRPWKEIPSKIEELTGVTNDLVAGAPEFATVFSKFAAFCGDSPLVTQAGYEFDFPLMDLECARCGCASLRNPRLDTKVIFYILHPARSENFSTNFLSDHYGVDRKPFKRHDALGDALLISRLFFAEMKEARSRELNYFVADEPRKIKRFVLPPL